jgi:S1-C subfamily serine protease
MRRPPARRPRRVAFALLLTAPACRGDASPAPKVVEVAAQPCASPNRAHGLGFVVADGIVATAAHTVEGPLRELTVDSAPASVAALDPRTDLALLAVELDVAPADLSTKAATAVTMLGSGPATPVRITRTGTLVVHDATDGVRYERQVHTFTPGVDDGTSGAPLVDEDGRVLGIVVLDNPGRGVAYAVTAGELTELVDRRRLTAATASQPGAC